MAEGEIALEIKEPPPPYDNENATETNNDENATESNYGKQPSESNRVESSKVKWFEYVGIALIYLIVGIALIVFIPLYWLYGIVMWLFCNIDVSVRKSDKQEGRNVDSFVSIYTGTIGIVSQQRTLPHVIQSRLAVFVFSWVIVNFTVPVLRKKTVLGTKLWKWTLLVTTILCGYHLINILRRHVVSALCLTPPFKRKQSCWVYYARGLGHSINLVAQAALILLSWVFYFRTDHGIKKTPETQTFLHVCTWSFVTFAVIAVLWLLKTVLLLRWKANAVYRRLSQRILVAREQVYILGYICRWNVGIFKPTSKEDKEKMILEGVDTHTEPTAEGVGAQPETSKAVEIIEEIIKEAKKKQKQILRIGKTDVNLFDIQQITEYFADVFKVSSVDMESADEIVKQCRKINRTTYPDGLVEEEDLDRVFGIDLDDAKKLLEGMRSTLQSQTISIRSFEKMMVKAHNNCVTLGHTLLYAGEVVQVLNKVMVTLLFGIVFVALLILTDVTTKFLVIIGSPLLALTFIFGDTCKKVFEGIVFSFINHPFDVGDRCIINNNTKVEVRRMSVFTTTFVDIVTNERILYPNSALVAVPITMLKPEPYLPDPSDCVELTLDSSYTKDMIGALDKSITDFFKNDTSGKFEKKCSVLVKDIGGGVKMEVQFQHVMGVNEITTSQCLKKKEEQKSYLYLHIKGCMDKYEQENKELMDKMKEKESPVAGTSK